MDGLGPKWTVQETQSGRSANVGPEINKWTVQFGSKPSTFARTSILRTVHFEPDSKLNSDSNPEVKSRVEKIRTWRKEQIDSMNEILSQIDSHYETLNELLSKRQEGLANEVCEHFEKR